MHSQKVARTEDIKGQAKMAACKWWSVHVNRNPLKITVEGQTVVQLYPEDDEPVNILNIKRGIVSALIVPVMEEERNKQMVAPLTVFIVLFFCHQCLQQ